MQTEEKYRDLMNKAITKINSLQTELDSYKNRSDVAVVGYNCRFPGGANSAQEFWELLCQGYDAVDDIPMERFDYKEYYAEKKSVAGKTYVKSGSFLKYDISKFDNFLFEMNEREATSLDPQHRLLLEVTWEAIMNAGLSFDELKGSRTGVFIGIDSYEYSMSEVVSGNLTDITPYSLMGNSAHAAAGRIAYFFDFKGPVMSFDTACSSSLTALNAAVQAFKDNQCDMAIVGGVNLMLSPNIFVSLSQMEALAPDGRCKAFDSSANGFGRGEGCGVIILKRLKNAVADGNYIEAVVKSVSVEHDGRTNGFYAPNGKSEKNVIETALKQSEISVDEIDYIETHGTGTVLGDSIEAQAICDAFGNRQSPMKIGSVKTNIGHLEAAAGIAGLMKVLLSMRFGYLPKNIHFNNPNPEINFNKLHVVERLEDWKNYERKRAAGISSFGISGTLVHTILQDAFVKKEPVEYCSSGVLTVSAETKEHLRNYFKELRSILKNEEKSIEKILIASNMTRSSMKYRVCICGHNREDFVKTIDTITNSDEVFEEYVYEKKRKKRRNDILINAKNCYEERKLAHLYSYSEIFREYFDTITKELAETLQLANSGLGLIKKKDKTQTENKVANFAAVCALIRLLDEIGATVGKIYGNKSVSSYISDGIALEQIAKILTSDSETNNDMTASDMLILDGIDIEDDLFTSIKMAYMNGFDIRFGLLHKDATNELPILPNYTFGRKAFWKTINFNTNRLIIDEKTKETPVQAVKPKIEGSVHDCVLELVSSVLSVKKDYINDKKSLLAYGFDSYSFSKLADQIRMQFEVNIQIQDLFGEYNNIDAIVEFIETNTENDVVETEAVAELVVERTDVVCPMSSAQQRLFSQIYMTNVDPFDMVGTYYVDGELDLAHFEWAVNEVLHRHKILSTSLFMKNGEFVQQYVSNTTITIRQIEQTLESELDSFISDSLCKFDLCKPPLVEVNLIHTVDNRMLMVFHFHHTVVDGISMNIFSQEVLKLYSGRQLTTLPFQYYDYVKWEENYVNSKEFAEEKEFWEKSLENINGKIELPYKKSGVTGNSMEGDAVTRAIPSELIANLRDFGINNQMTMFMTFLVGLNIMLSKLSNREDIYLAVPVACRNKGQFQDNIGMFTNTLAFYANVKKNKKLISLVDEVKSFCLKAYKYPNYQFNMIADDNNLDIHNALNIAYVYENIGDRLESPDGLQFTMHDYTARIQEFEIAFEFLEHNGEVDCVVRYHKDLFTKQTINRMVDQFLLVLSQFKNNSNETLLKDIILVSEEEKNKVLNIFNNTDLAFDREKTIVSAFEKLVSEQPMAVALRRNQDEMTYGELNRRANQLAHRLISFGIKTDDLVVLESVRGFEMFVAILGIMKAGGAYVPIDPAYPMDRKLFIINECKAKCVVTYNVSDKFVNVVQIEMEDLVDVPEYDENPNVAITPSNLAYCIFTSGTSGTPKGVMLEHHGVISMQAYLFDLYRVKKTDKILQFANYVFDASVWEFTMSILMGACLVIVEADVIGNIARFNQYVNEQKIGYALLPPQYYLLTDIRDLKVLTTGGSASSKEVILKAKENGRYINAYGPSENTVLATHWEYQGDDELIPIGKPISNTKAYVMNGDELCGIGMLGELCLTGEGLARGYLNQPKLTEEKFVENPFGTGKMYRTGDLVRWTEDGDIEYLGRIDEQVKIRGYRIELGEIESLIRQIDGVIDSTVIVREDQTGEKAIFAYYVSNVSIAENEILGYLKKNVPSYMIPAGLMQIDEIPFNASGKVDRKKLPAIQKRARKEGTPRNEIEQYICELFETILCTECVGIYDDFFDLGGHSLRVTRLINMIAEKYGCQFEARDIFKNETPEKIAALIESNGGMMFTKLEKVETKDYYPMSAAQKRVFISCQVAPEGLSYNLPACIKIVGEIDIEELETSLNKVVERHETLHTVFDVVGEELVQKVQPIYHFDIPCVEGITSDMDSLLKDFVQPFNLTELPLVRMKVVKEQEVNLILLDMHHIVSDGMSMKLFIDELVSIYNGEELEPMSYQYKDYCKWLEERDLTKEKEFWDNQFADEFDVLDIQTDFKRPAEKNFAGAKVEKKVNKTLKDKLEAIANKKGYTDYMIMLSVIMILLSKYSRQDDVIVGSVSSGRNHPSTENMIGMFVNTLALRGKVEKSKSYIDFLNEIRELVFDVFENDQYPFEKLVESIDCKKESARNPLFDIIFTFQNNEAIKAQFNGAEVVDFIQYQEIAKFDMQINVEIVDGEYVIQNIYSTDLYRREFAEAFLEHFMVVLEAVLDNQEILIQDIPTVTDEEKKTIDKVFNDTAVDFDDTITFVDKFEDVVNAHPDEIALILNNEEMTYAELNRRANQIAYFIRSKGIERNQFVGLHTVRGFEMFIALLGVIKSGAAYVPLDTEYPQAKKDFILEDTKAKLVITYGSTYESKSGIEVVDINDIAQLPENNINPERCNVPGDLIYTIFTSGTTGEPKGVLISHSGVVALDAYLEHVFGPVPGDHVLQFANYVFDASVYEYSLAFLHGATMLLITDEVIKDIQQFNNYMAEKRVDFALIPPQYYLLSDLKGLKILTTGGSASSKEVLDKARSNNEHYINLYGPTECTVISTYWESNDEHDELIPIGKPISNAKGYVMQDGKLCGIGIPGELCISGPGVSRGYLNREELTKKQFTPNPFGPGNIYHTGDLVRWNSDGDIEYLGRIDEQVKVRGYRIELGEVESAVRRCEDVTDCAVIIRDGADGQAALFAYFVSPKTIDIVDIHRQLSDVLPKYMIPSYIMQLDRIPINSSGKIDKRRLPDISNIVTEAYAASEEKREIILCQAFEEILGVEKVGIHDNFFNLGGDSIKAIRIVSQVREMGYRLTTKKIMEACIVSKIALEMERDDAVVYDQDAVVGEVTSLPIVKMFKKWELPVPGHFNQSTMLKFVDDCQVVIIESLKILVGHHDMLRAVYQNDKLVIRPTTAANLFEFETFIFTSDITDDQIRGLCDRIQSEIDIENGPLVHCGYFATKSGYYLLISAHHLIVDNISWHIILEDLNHIIYRLKVGQHPKLPKKTASYKSWCNLYEEFAATESCKEQEAFWQDQVSQIVDGNLKADLNLSGQGFASKTVSFDEDVTEKFLHQSNHAYNTESMDILLAALGKAVNNISSTEKVAVWLEGHGRHELHMHIDVDRTVGWFTNCYPLILKNYASLEDQVIGIKELVHDIPMKGIGYGAFVDNFEDFVYPSISLNYLGEIVSNDKFDVNLASLTGRDIAEENGYITDIVFNGKVADGNLQFDVFYNQNLYSDKLITNLIRSFTESIKQIVDFCSGKNETVKTKSDIAMTTISNDEYDEIMSLF